MKKHTRQWNYSEVARHLLKVTTADPGADWRCANAGSVWGRVASAMGRSNTRNIRKLLSTMWRENRGNLQVILLFIS